MNDMPSHARPSCGNRLAGGSGLKLGQTLVQAALGGVTAIVPGVRNGSGGAPAARPPG